MIDILDINSRIFGTKFKKGAKGCIKNRNSKLEIPETEYEMSYDDCDAIDGGWNWGKFFVGALVTAVVATVVVAGIAFTGGVASVIAVEGAKFAVGWGVALAGEALAANALGIAGSAVAAGVVTAIYNIFI